VFLKFCACGVKSKLLKNGFDSLKRTWQATSRYGFLFSHRVRKMAKADLGEKRVCAECSAKFFDLKKRPVVCPKCGFSFDPDATTRRPARKVEPTPKPKDAEEEAAEEDEDADEEDALEDEEDEDQKELSLDDAAPILATDGDEESDSDSGGSTRLPEGYTEEGVEDDSEILTDDEDEDAKLVDEEELDGDD
jgi:uncharacterized protein (TIGR02300 family)